MTVLTNQMAVNHNYILYSINIYYLSSLTNAYLLLLSLFMIKIKFEFRGENFV